MNKVYLSLGSNRSNRVENLNTAIKLLDEKAGKIIIASSLYETQPWKMEDETDFINQIILLETVFTPSQLMSNILQIEIVMGRVRKATKYEARIIDIDILFFNDEIINTPELHIPHPLIQQRMFILKPMAQIAAEYIHPVSKKSIEQLLDECEDKSRIKSHFQNNT